MTTYKYLVLDCEGPSELERLINESAEDGWELVPGQSVAVVVTVEISWSYTVIMRKLA